MFDFANVTENGIRRWNIPGLCLLSLTIVIQDSTEKGLDNSGIINFQSLKFIESLKTD